MSRDQRRVDLHDPAHDDTGVEVCERSLASGETESGAKRIVMAQAPYIRGEPFGGR
jgi:hypothetical protein